jgi:hypothetical protein
MTGVTATDVASPGGFTAPGPPPFRLPGLR